MTLNICDLQLTARRHTNVVHEHVAQESAKDSNSHHRLFAISPDRENREGFNIVNVLGRSTVVDYVEDCTRTHTHYSSKAFATIQPNRVQGHAAAGTLDQSCQTVWHDRIVEHEELNQVPGHAGSWKIPKFNIIYY